MLQWTCVIPGTSVGNVGRGLWPLPIRRVRLAADPPVLCVSQCAQPGSPDERTAWDAREACNCLTYTRILPCQNSWTGGLPDLLGPAHFVDGAARLRHDLRKFRKLGLGSRGCFGQRQDRGFEV